ncbi:MAG: DNA repair exonuclease [Pirellulales bacterium]|nr:DNA repair exonuclease [Pirellulales bacterium]
MKFLHTADWQIGMRAAHVGGVAARVRDERLAAARRVVDVARHHQVEFLLLAGDTFEDNRVDRRLVQTVADTLAGFGGPVYLLPGNHDPLVPGSVWEHGSWSAYEDLHVIEKAEPIDLLGGRLYPCPVFEKHSSEDPTRWIEAVDDGSIAIGVAHGSVEGIPQERPELPIPRDAAARHGLDYLALGHWHSTVTYDGHMAYSGAHEPTKFDERDSGNVLLVEIAGRGAAPRLTPIRTGGLTWTSLDEEVRAEGDLGRARQRIEAIDSPDRTLLDLCLRGVLHAVEQPELVRIEELAAARFLFHRIDASRLLPGAEDDRWLADLPQGPLRETARRLQSWAGAEPVEGRPDCATPEVAARALVELYAMSVGGPR